MARGAYNVKLQTTTKTVRYLRHCKCPHYEAHSKSKAIHGLLWSVTKCYMETICKSGIPKLTCEKCLNRQYVENSSAEEMNGIPAACATSFGTVTNTVQVFGQNLVPSGIIPKSLRRFKIRKRRELVVAPNVLLSQALI